MASSTCPRVVLSLVLAAACNSGAATPKPTPQSTAITGSTSPTPAPALGPDDDPHYRLAREYEAAGRFVEARNEVELALAAGAGRDATLLAAKLAILRDDLDAAKRLLDPLAADAGDALVLYNLGLIAQRRGEYNNARTRYIAALQADPNYAAARHNLAVLTWDAGARQEAQHHAQKFFELSPDDPRAHALRRQVGLEIPEGPAADQPATPQGQRGDLVNPFAKPTGDGLVDPFAKQTGEQRGPVKRREQQSDASRGLVNPFEQR